VSADLALLQGSVGDLRSAGSGTAFEPDAERPGSAAAPGASAEPAVAASDEIDDEPAPIAEAPLDEEEAADDGDDRAADEEGARLIALNMALNGTPRDETEQYLSENFELDDPQALLDDVYARAGQ
jgi:hypothetical protein